MKVQADLEAATNSGATRDAVAKEMKERNDDLLKQIAVLREEKVRARFM